MTEERNDEKQEIELPTVSFENHILSLYNLAIINFGIRDPETGKIIRNLPVAKHTIDTIGMLQEKTKGNLTAPENNFLENILYELRMNYLRALKDSENEPKDESQAKEKPADEVKEN